MKPYCEVVVTRILPAMRSLITNELVKKYGLTQRQAADLLGLTQAAVSQYSREARGSRVKLLEKEPEIMRMIDDLTSDIVSRSMGGKEIQARFCKICKTIRKKGLICSIHEEIYPTIAPASVCPDLRKDA